MAQRREINVPVDKSLASVLVKCEPSAVERLALNYAAFFENAPRIKSRVSCDALLHALKGFHHLRQLALKAFTPSTALIAPTMQNRASLPITRLELSHYSSGALDVVQLCPQLTELSLYQGQHSCFSTPQRRIAGPENPWPSLQLLEIGHHDDINLVLDRVRAVRRLHVGFPLPYCNAEDHPHAEILHRLVQKSLPIELSLPLRAVENAPSAFWTEIAKAPEAGQLHVLMLDVWVYRMDSSLISCLDALPQSLSTLTITVLRLQILWSAAARQHLMAPGYHDEEHCEQEKRDIAQARSMEPLRTKLLQDLPRRLASAIPSLRYLAIIDDAPSLLSLAWADYRVALGERLANAGTTDSGPGQGGDADHASVVDSEEGVESRRTYQHYGERCWEVRDGEDEKELIDITREDWQTARERVILGAPLRGSVEGV
ncbi:hypothetical protein PYCCODRAFT_1461735 [Trametes coccinea BRFM310]|uniref:F-box domain-containing protein n=1 Tax=Trametes coccinea (strain BRFM310) TaxID=1353009 RepID=A0A1Y2ICP3_TRAC3|nr:hypothetical protein PYCCODRAFT_1461735 [Trametes coccinea BRFM310]